MVKEVENNVNDIIWNVWSYAGSGIIICLADHQGLLLSEPIMDPDLPSETQRLQTLLSITYLTFKE